MLYRGTVQLNQSKEAKFHKARPVFYALQSKVENALLKMEKDGVLERVTSASNVSQIIVVDKNTLTMSVFVEILD